MGCTRTISVKIGEVGKLRLSINVARHVIVHFDIRRIGSNFHNLHRRMVDLNFVSFSTVLQLSGRWEFGNERDNGALFTIGKISCSITQ